MTDEPRIYAEIVKLLHEPDTQKRLTGDGGQIITSTPEQFAAYIKSEIGRFARVAGVVNRACEEGRFDRLVLVAPARALGELRPLLSARAPELEAKGMLEPGKRTEDILVVGGRR